MPADRQLVMRLQAVLVAHGFDLGRSGPAQDGVDGDPGDRTILAALSLIESRVGIESPLKQPGLTDAAAFFASLRRSGLFGAGLTRGQVDGINFKLAAMTAANWPISWAATAFGTVYHETAKTMQPIRERGSGRDLNKNGWDDYFEKYDTGRLAASLGNSPAADGDGVLYIGRGDVMVTGLANYRKLAKLLGVDVVAQPDLLLRPDLSARAMIVGMENGIYTGKSLPGVLGRDKGRKTRADYVRTRPIINGTDKAEMIAGYCIAFEAALAAGLWVA